MSKPYNPTKHLKLNKFKQEGYAYFENIDFSASDNKDILATMLLDFPRIVFQKCIFKSLIATKQIFNATISFDELMNVSLRVKLTLANPYLIKLFLLRTLHSMAKLCL